MVGEIYLIIVRLCNLAEVGEPACACVLIYSGSVTHRHDGELAVVVDPWRRLVGLLEAADLVGVISVCPAVSHCACHGSPEVHAPWKGDCRISVTCRE